MIALARCQRHPGREAAARCPSCQQSFCRECITEHEGRMLCLACLTKRSQPATGRGA
jgi:formylmethanofuran dehydrogenase subunit E